MGSIKLHIIQIQKGCEFKCLQTPEFVHHHEYRNILIESKIDTLAIISLKNTLRVTWVNMKYKRVKSLRQIFFSKMTYKLERRSK